VLAKTWLISIDAHFPVTHSGRLCRVSVASVNLLNGYVYMIFNQLESPYAYV